MAGAQIPAELTASWLRHATSTRFRVEFVQPIEFSDSGFRALAEDRCDLACTDRLIQSREREHFSGAPFAGRRIAFYGYAFYVHPTNVLDNIFSGHIKLLMRGRITDWKELGGRAGPIHLVGPKKSTRGGEILMRQAGLWFRDPPWQTCASDSQIIDQVAIDPFALGFASIGFDQGARYLGLRMDRNGKPAFPSIEEIESERYGLAKVIYVYYRSPPSTAVRAALTELSSESGRNSIEHTEAWPIPPERAALPS